MGFLVVQCIRRLFFYKFCYGSLTNKRISQSLFFSQFLTVHRIQKYHWTHPSSLTVPSNCLSSSSTLYTSLVSDLARVTLTREHVWAGKSADDMTSLNWKRMHIHFQTINWTRNSNLFKRRDRSAHIHSDVTQPKAPHLLISLFLWLGEKSEANKRWGSNSAAYHHYVC